MHKIFNNISQSLTPLLLEMLSHLKIEAASNIESFGTCKETKVVLEKCCKYSREIKNLLSSVAKELVRETQEFSDEEKEN